MLQDSKQIIEKCGIIAFYSNKPTLQLKSSLIAAAGVQHRGQHGAGLAQRRNKKTFRYVGNGLLKEAFPKSIIDKFDKKSIWTLVHCRYGTFGGYGVENLQPCTITTKDNHVISVIHNGEFVATDEIRKKIKGPVTEGVSDTSLFTLLLSQQEGKNWDEKIKTALSQIKGAYSLAIGVNDTIYLARDEFGIKPFVIGQLDENWIAVSESHALDKLGVKVIREIKRGEIIRIDKKGLTIIQEGLKGRGNFCDFEWAYFAKPNSIMPINKNEDDYKNPENWETIASFREKCGEIIAQEAPIKHASFVVGTPDSGVYVAMGYANAMHLPYRQVIIRDHFDPNGAQRLFMRDDEMSSIGKKVLGKLSLLPDKRIWKDAVVVVGDDSIVRGNVTNKITQAIFALGAREVHLIVGFPAVSHRCFLGISMRTEGELIAARHTGDPKKISQEIGATSIHYISHRGFCKAKLLTNQINNPKNKKEIFLRNGGCGGCVTGLYPVNKKGEVYNLSNKIPKKQIIPILTPTTQENPLL